MRLGLLTMLAGLMAPAGTWAEVPSRDAAQPRVPLTTMSAKERLIIPHAELSQYPPDEAPCDPECVAKKAGLLALPAATALGSAAMLDKFPVHEKVIYTGLPGQPMKKSEIREAMQFLRTNKAFERSNHIVVDSAELHTSRLTESQLEEKLQRYASEGRGVSKIAIRNPRVVPAAGLASAVGTAVFIVLELRPARNHKKPGSSDLFDQDEQVKTHSTEEH